MGRIHDALKIAEKERAAKRLTLDEQSMNRVQAIVDKLERLNDEQRIVKALALVAEENDFTQSEIKRALIFSLDAEIMNP